MKKIKMCAITTRALTMESFMVENLKFATKNGFEVTIICEHNCDLEKNADNALNYIPINMKSGVINPIDAIKHIIQLYTIFKKNNFDIVQYASTNAGLYSALAAWCAKVPVRVFCQWGLLYIGYEGIKRKVFKFIEMLTCKLSTIVQPDSHSNLSFAIDEHLYKRDKGEIIWNGSACGVDLSKFSISKRAGWRKELTKELHIGDKSITFGFVGRIVKDKGINELLEAFRLISIENANLILVGPLDGEDEIDSELLLWAKNSKKVHFLGQKNDVFRYYSLFDYLILPSYREGFGTVLIEAAAMGIPSIISNIIGPKDIIVDGYNGFVCECKSALSLKESLEKAVNLSIEQYKSISTNAYNVVLSKYSADIYREEFVKNRIKLIDNYRKEVKQS